MNSLTLRAVVAELHPYRGLRLDAVAAADPWEFHLRLEKQVTLVVCVHPEHNALFPAPGDALAAEGTHPFTRALAKALEGARFAGASQAGLDRVAALTFERRDRLGDARRTHLVAELTGKGGNLLLVDGDDPWTGRILDRLRDDHSRRAPRHLAPGAPYELPASSKTDATRSGAPALADALRAAMERRGESPRALVDAWMGVGPVTAEAVWREAGPDPETDLLARTWLDFLEAVRPEGPAIPPHTVSAPHAAANQPGATTQPAATNQPGATAQPGATNQPGATAQPGTTATGRPGPRFAPTLVTGPEHGAEAFAFAPGPEHTGPEPPAEESDRASRAHSSDRRSYPTASAAVAAAHRRFRREHAAGPHEPLHRPVRQALARTRRALESLDRDARDAEEAGTLRRLGEALLASAHTITRGADRVRVPDPAGGPDLEVDLDPRLTPAENAERYFKRAKKAERAGAKLPRRRRELLKRRESLEGLVRGLEEAGSDGPDPAWFEEAARLGVSLPREELPPEPESGPGDRLTAALRPRRYELGNGWEVLVGKSNRGNEVLTLEIARPHDVWMHADQVPGSHVVLRHHEKGKEAPKEVLLAAAAIAAFFSKARGSGKVSVLITEKRQVRKPRKAPVGTVTVGQHRTVMVSPADPDRRGRR